MLYLYEKEKCKILDRFHGVVVSKDTVKLDDGGYVYVAKNCEISENEDLSQCLLRDFVGPLSQSERLDQIEELLASLIFGGEDIA